MSDAAFARSWSWRWSARGVWLGPIAFVLSLLGTELLVYESLRSWAVLLLIGAGILAVLAWSNNLWPPAFPADRSIDSAYARLRVTKWRPSVTMLVAGVLFLALSHVAFLAAPRSSFGLAGQLWLAAIPLVTVAALLQPLGELPHNRTGSDGPPVWSWWEIAGLVSIAVLALVLRTWNLRNVPFNIFPDEVMTGVLAEQAYLKGANPAPPIFSTLWSDVELPALWFAIVAGGLKLCGVSLAAVRLPSALFGAATVVPFYAFVRNVWGRVAAIAGATIMAVSASNVHYSRIAIHVTTPFFWTMCFFFLLRGLRTRRPVDWALAGVTAGLSEHFYYGTRLLPFILIGFVLYLLVVHWCQAKRYITQVAWLVLGYLVGFGPLLSYFVTHRGFYYERGAGLMTWNRLPVTGQDWQQMWHTLWPIMSENLLGVSTNSAQDIVYYAPLLLIPEAALLVLGVALLIWRWRHPAAFILLLSGAGVLFVGGTLVLYPNSSPPMLVHWAPAFPAFYTAIAVPIGAWAASAKIWLSPKSRWIATAVVVLVLMMSAYGNIQFYFFKYYADPASLRVDRYRAAQRLYEEQTVQSRYMASLGAGYRVIVVGKSPYPYDSEITRYLVQGQEYISTYDPETQLPLSSAPEKGLAFLFFPGSEQYREIIRERYPHGMEEEVRNPVGRHVFYTYVMKPQITRRDLQRR